VTKLRQHAINAYIGSIILLGCIALLGAVFTWESHDPLRFVSFLIAAALASVLKVRLPGVTGAVSVLAIFVLVSIANLSLPEAIVLGSAAMLVQCTWLTQVRAKPVQVAFSVDAHAIAIYVSSFLFHLVRPHSSQLLSLGLLAAVFYLTNTFPVAYVIALTEKKSVLNQWREYRWTLAFYVVGCSMAWLVSTVPNSVQWELPIICLPLVYMVHRSNREHIDHVEQVNKHMVEMNELHLRTIEALACAIDAKDHNTHDHLQRVQFYAMEIGKELGLSEN
jgi:hypothetical protein